MIALKNTLTALALLAVAALVIMFVAAQTSSSAAPAHNAAVAAANTHRAMIDIHTQIIEAECEAVLEEADLPAYCVSPIIQRVEVENRIASEN